MEIRVRILQTGALAAALLVAALTAPVCVAQAIVSSIEKGGNITVNAPAGLTQRSNDADKAKDTDKARDKEGENDKGESDKGENASKKADDGQPQAGRQTTRQTVASRGYGFRIQAFTSSSKQDAQRRAREFAAKFPNYRTYIAFKSPTWRLRVGDFKNNKDAQAAMQRMRAVFPAYAGQMSVVKDHINNWE